MEITNLDLYKQNAYNKLSTQNTIMMAMHAIAFLILAVANQWIGATINAVLIAFWIYSSHKLMKQYFKGDFPK